MGVRHAHRKACVVIAGEGLENVVLDEAGVVVNLDDLGEDAKERLLERPNFMDLDRFPLTEAEVASAEAWNQETPEQAIERHVKNERDTVAGIMKQLASQPGATDETGRVTMEALNGALRQAGLNPISLSQRRSLEGDEGGEGTNVGDAATGSDEVTTGEQQPPEGTPPPSPPEEGQPPAPPEGTPPA